MPEIPWYEIDKFKADDDAADSSRTKSRKKSLQASMRKFGLTAEDYHALLRQQGDRCAVCRQPPTPGKRLHVDHKHGDARVRGLLCGPCNRAIGSLGDDPDMLDAAAAYLRRYNDKWRAILES